MTLGAQGGQGWCGRGMWQSPEAGVVSAKPRSRERASQYPSLPVRATRATQATCSTPPGNCCPHSDRIEGTCPVTPELGSKACAENGHCVSVMWGQLHPKAY